MSTEMTPAQHEWLGKRVRVGAGCAPEVTMAEGTVVGYLSAPSVIVRDAQGRDSTWMVTLPIDVLGEVPDDELPEQAVDTGSRNRELRSQLYEFLGARTSRAYGEPHGHESLLKLSGELAQLVEQLPTPMEDKLGEILRGAGIEYPLGLRGVRDLVNQRDGHLERAQEAEELVSRTHEAMMAKYAEAGQLRDRAERVEQQLEIDRREHGRSLDAVQRRLELATARADAAERRLANVREMVGRLRAAAGGGVTPGYVLVRVEDMLNGQEPT